MRSTLIGDFVPHPAGRAPEGSLQEGPFHTLEFAFVLEPAPG
ncbi:hypothetical protein [Variovorax sp. VRV01]|nr:hypothetical protein [Variovorax sp. VRV01]